MSSSRRKATSLEDFQGIFERRGIQGRLTGFLSNYPHCTSRKEEILAFLPTIASQGFIILDDDKSLNGLAPSYKKRLVLTSYLQGFKEEQLSLALVILNKKSLS